MVMRSAAYAADRADQMHAAMLRRAWGPPIKRKGRPPTGAPPSKQNPNNSKDNSPAAAGQRAVSFAIRRAAVLERRAALLRSIGWHLQAERLSQRAAELRAVAL